MTNITLSVDEQIVKKVRKIAIDQNTTLTAMVREYLQSIAARDTADRERLIRKLEQDFERRARDMGPRTWTRDGLYD